MVKTMNQTKAYLLLERVESPFLNQINEAISYADNNLPLINNVFNTYTMHGMRHAVNVAEYMFELVEYPEELSELELSMIIYAALFHDIGMVVLEEAVKSIRADKLLLGNRKYSKVLEKYQDDKIALQECVRPVHGRLSRSFIEDIDENSKMFLIPEATAISFQSELALICQAHNEDFSWISNNLEADVVKGKHYLNAQYIAVLLRIGDYLDIDEQRAPLYLYRCLNLQEYSDLEWQQHFSIENYDKICTNEKTGQKEIIFHGSSDNPTVHRKLLKYFDSINKELVNAVSFCERYERRMYLLNLRSHVINKMRSKGFTFSDFRLELDYNAVTNLLMGEHIYGNKKYGLREIIQNAIDACKTMQETAETHLDYTLQKYSPFISIALDKDRNKVTILDNGSGMSVDILKKYFLNVGVSYYKSDDYVLQGKKYLPIGHYGIGFLACFMLSDRVEVKTRYMDENQLTKIEFEKNSEYICLTYEEKYKEQGTEITLDYEQFMRVFGNEEKSVLRFIESNFLDCGIPINILFQENGQIVNEKCNLEKIDRILPEKICLNKYLEGIEAYIQCDYKQINFASKISDLNRNASYYYDEVEKCVKDENECELSIKDSVKGGDITFISVPAIEDQEEEFEKAFEVLGDFSEALDRINVYHMINFVPSDAGGDFYEGLVRDNEAIIGEYFFEQFCHEFPHSSDIPTHTFEEKFFVIANDVSDRVLPYNKSVSFSGRVFFEQNDKVFIKNVLLSKLRITIPFLVAGISLKGAVVNIENDDFFPNVSRDNISDNMRNMLSYAIGKALHLWFLDNVSLSVDEKALLEDFLSQCYPDRNNCLK